MSIMLTAIRVDRLEGFSETLLIACDPITGVMVGRNLEIESGKASEWRNLPPVPLKYVRGEDDQPATYELFPLPEARRPALSITDEDAERLRNIATVLRDICPEEMDDEGIWLAEWVKSHTTPLAPRALESDIAEDRH